ncbi:MAG TPA: alpha/beta hydrolase, partial [Aggregatilineales bacterium]|nr:alpha/beta hydrolase [Aggregatilineales bacterium]
MSHQHWTQGYVKQGAGPLPGTWRAAYSVATLANSGLLKQDAVRAMLLDSGLRDFSWDVAWADDSLRTADGDNSLRSKILEAEGYVVFVHGWTGTRAIWEDLPARLVQANPRLVALVVDHNGFGNTPFVDPMPAIAECNPVGAMRAVESWFDLLQLRRQPGSTQTKTVNFVGHSMGGAALFFLREAHWRQGEQTRLAISPALLLHDEIHRAFYTTLGLGIGLVGRLRVLEVIDNLVSPSVIEVLADGATQQVRDIHTQVYDSTPKSVTARTFAAMGLIDEHPGAHHWDLMRVVLGHRDRLVGLVPALDLMQELQFDVDQVRVVMGTHYLFSVGEAMASL